MSIDKPIFEVTVKLKEELAARQTLLSRIVTKNETTGYYEPEYPVEIEAERTTYEVDENNNRLAIYDKVNLGRVVLSQEQTMSLWAEEVTLQDGTKLFLGELLANKIDSVIDNHFNVVD